MTDATTGGAAVSAGGSGTSITVKGDVNTTGDFSTGVSVDGQGSSVTVEGDVSATKGSGVSAGGTDTSVTVTGDVEGLWSGVSAEGSAQVTVNGDVQTNIMGISRKENSGITVEGKIQSLFRGIYTSGNSEVTVGSLESGGYAISADGNSKVTVEGDVNAGVTNFVYTNTSMLLSSEAQILIDGDLSFQSADSKISVLGASQTGELLIGGELQNEGKSVALVVSVDESGALKELPEIVIGEVEDFAGLQVQTVSLSQEGVIYQELDAEQKQQVLDSIKYIVSSNSDSLDGKGSFQITKVNGDALAKDQSDQYEVAQATETITVHVNVQDGYEVTELKAGKATVSRNADGSYSVTVPYGGGVNIEAVIREIEIQEQERSRREGRSGTSPFWHQSSVGGWYYIKDTGTRAVSEWLQLEWNGSQGWYYFGTDGQMLTGWQEIDGVRYFLNDQSREGYPLGCWIPDAA